MPVLRLDLSWLVANQRIGDLEIERSTSNELGYDDGITLAVDVYFPEDFPDLSSLLQELAATARAGAVQLVAGTVPIEWRSEMRAQRVSFVDPSGVAELSWPRLSVSTGQFAQKFMRERQAVPLQKSHAKVLQEIIRLAMLGKDPTISELARQAGVTQPTASRAVTKLAAHGFLAKRKVGSQVFVEVADTARAAQLLSERTVWPAGPVTTGYRWGRSILDVAGEIARHAAQESIDIAITGAAALPFYGVAATSEPRTVRCWVGATSDLQSVAHRIGLEPVELSRANVEISFDRWGFGTHRAEWRTYSGWESRVASPLRVWVDIHSERRGADFAHQMWRQVAVGLEAEQGGA